MGEVEFKRVSPCRHCADRSVGCHGLCEDYIKWATLNRAAREKDRLSRLGSGTICKSSFTGTSPKPGKTRWKH